MRFSHVTVLHLGCPSSPLIDRTIPLKVSTARNFFCPDHAIQWRTQNATKKKSDKKKRMEKKRDSFKVREKHGRLLTAENASRGTIFC